MRGAGTAPCAGIKTLSGTTSSSCLAILSIRLEAEGLCTFSHQHLGSATYISCLQLPHLLHHCAVNLIAQVVIERLVSSACFSHPRGLSLEPLSGYQVLYDFLTAWGHFKHAAAAMLAFARRLRSMAAGGSSNQADKKHMRQVVAEVQGAYGECKLPHTNNVEQDRLCACVQLLLFVVTPRKL